MFVFVHVHTRAEPNIQTLQIFTHDHFDQLHSWYPHIVCVAVCVLSVLSLLYSVLSVFQLQHRLAVTDEGVYPAVVESIGECLSIRRDELHQQLIQSSCAISHNQLVTLLI